MVWNEANDPQEHLEDQDEWDCDANGHEWQLLTRHADPPWVRPGALPNAICPHCSEQTWIDLAGAGDEGQE